MRWSAAPLLVFALASAFEGTACADEPSKVYAEGAAALKKGDYRGAAILFARADELAPNDVALLQALEAAELADDPPLSMALATRATRSTSAALGQAAKRVRARFGDRAARITLTCPNGMTCALRIDGSAVGPPTDGWVRAGTHEVVIVADGREEARPVTLVGGTIRELIPTPVAPVKAPDPLPPPPPRATEPSPSGWSPGWFYGAASVTVVLGIATAVSALDARSKRASFEDDPNPATRDAGRSAEVRSNVLLVSTSIALLSTAAIGVFAVRWSSASATVALTGSGVRLAIAF